MENQTNMSKLSEKVSNILARYNSLKDENERLRLDVVTLKSECELKNQEIENLIEQNIMKDLEIEEIVEKIERMIVTNE